MVGTNLAPRNKAGVGLIPTVTEQVASMAIDRLATDPALVQEKERLLREKEELQRRCDTLLAKNQEYAEKLAATGQELRNLEEANARLRANVQQLKDKIARLKADRETLILVELGRQVERQLCRAVLGSTTAVTSLSMMFKELKQNSQAKTKWEELEQNLRWSNELWGSVQYLKELRMDPGHPTVDTDGNHVTKALLIALANKKSIPMVHKPNVSKLAELLEKFRTASNLYEKDD